MPTLKKKIDITRRKKKILSEDILITFDGP
jgi:hypothetical protein